MSAQCIARAERRAGHGLVRCAIACSANDIRPGCPAGPTHVDYPYSILTTFPVDTLACQACARALAHSGTARQGSSRPPPPWAPHQGGASRTRARHIACRQHSCGAAHETGRSSASCGYFQASIEKGPLMQRKFRILSRPDYLASPRNSIVCLMLGIVCQQVGLANLPV